MDSITKTLRDLATSEQAITALQALLILACGFLIASVLNRRVPTGALQPQQRMLLRRGVKYLVVGLTITLALRVLGVSLSFLLGTAGILTVAIGFAAQTSASNLISGLFLMAERPFVLGDVIAVGDTQGEVVSIELLSVRLRTFDNLLVRIPNETMLKSNLTNLTHYPIRRFDMKLGVAYKQDLDDVRAALERVAANNHICLQEPQPLFLILGFGESSVDLQFSIWSTRESFLMLRTTMHQAVKEEFEACGIEIPFPQRVVHTTSDSTA